MSAAHPREAAERRVQMQFDDNTLLPQLFGERDRNLERIEQQLGVSVVSRGNRLAIAGPAARADIARAALQSLYDRLAARPRDRHRRGRRGAASAPARQARALGRRRGDPHPQAPHQRRAAPAQAHTSRRCAAHDLVFGLGPAGTGKTYLAVAMAVDMLMSGAVERIVLSRPAVEAGERLGFLPGDLREKVDPYLRPLYDALYDMLPGEQVMQPHRDRRDRDRAARLHARPHAWPTPLSSSTRRRTPRRCR